MPIITVGPAFQSNAFQQSPLTFQSTGHQIQVTDTDADSQIVAQTATPLVQPLTRKQFAKIEAEKQARLDAWNALTPLQQLRIEIGDLETELRAEPSDRRDEGLRQRIAETQRKIGRWEQAEAHLRARGQNSMMYLGRLIKF